MNYIGKILVGLILVMSLVFMSFAIAVWSVNRNYYEAIKGPNGWSQKLTQARAEKQQLTQEKEELLKQLNAETAAKRAAVARLESEVAGLQRQNRDLSGRQAELADATTRAVTAMQSMQQNLAKFRDEVLALRDSIRETQVDRDDQFRRFVDLTDELHQSSGMLERLKETQLQLVAQNARMKGVLESQNLDEFASYSETVEGQIAVVRSNLVEVTIGGDDGLKTGDTLEVYRGSNYLGRVRVLQTDPDTAVCEIVKGLQQGYIQRGDNVTTRLKI